MRSSGPLPGSSFFLFVMLIFVVGLDDPGRQSDGTIQQWGTMREALRDGQTQARVRLDEAVSRPHAYGVGALEGLSGEVTIVDGKVWLAQPAGDACNTTAPGELNESATLLAVAYVPTWHKIEITREIPDAEWESFLQSNAKEHGVATDKPFAFMVLGKLDVEGHVINGSCPMADAQSTDARDPFRFNEHNRQGRAVGFYAEGAGGTLTHHGQSTHMHVVYEDDPALSGHVDRLHVHAGATLFLPSDHG